MADGKHLSLRSSERLCDKRVCVSQHRIAQHYIQTQSDQEGFYVHIIFRKGKGVFAGKNFFKGDFLVQYDGELCDAREGYIREYTMPSVFRYFFHYKKKEYCIDATSEPMDGPKYGRLINHSQKPNSKMKVLELKGRPYLVLFALRNISCGEEIVYRKEQIEKSACGKIELHTGIHEDPLNVSDQSMTGENDLHPSRRADQLQASNMSQESSESILLQSSYSDQNSACDKTTELSLGVNNYMARYTCDDKFTEGNTSEQSTSRENILVTARVNDKLAAKYSFTLRNTDFLYASDTTEESVSKEKNDSFPERCVDHLNVCDATEGLTTWKMELLPKNCADNLPKETVEEDTSYDNYLQPKTGQSVCKSNIKIEPITQNCDVNEKSVSRGNVLFLQRGVDQLTVNDEIEGTTIQRTELLSMNCNDQLPVNDTVEETISGENRLQPRICSIVKFSRKDIKSEPITQGSGIESVSGENDQFPGECNDQLTFCDADDEAATQNTEFLLPKNCTDQLPVSDTAEGDISHDKRLLPKKWRCVSQSDIKVDSTCTPQNCKFVQPVLGSRLTLSPSTVNMTVSHQRDSYAYKTGIHQSEYGPQSAASSFACFDDNLDCCHQDIEHSLSQSQCIDRLSVSDTKTESSFSKDKFMYVVRCTCDNHCTTSDTMEQSTSGKSILLAERFSDRLSATVDSSSIENVFPARRSDYILYVSGTTGELVSGENDQSESVSGENVFLSQSGVDQLTVCDATEESVTLKTEPLSLNCADKLPVKDTVEEAISHENGLQPTRYRGNIKVEPITQNCDVNNESVSGVDQLTVRDESKGLPTQKTELLSNDCVDRVSVDDTVEETSKSDRQQSAYTTSSTHLDNRLNSCQQESWISDLKDESHTSMLLKESAMSVHPPTQLQIRKDQQVDSFGNNGESYDVDSDCVDSVEDPDFIPSSFEVVNAVSRLSWSNETNGIETKVCGLPKKTDDPDIQTHFCSKDTLPNSQNQNPEDMQQVVVSAIQSHDSLFKKASHTDMHHFKKKSKKLKSQSSSVPNGVVVLTSNNTNVKKVWDKPLYCPYCRRKLAGKLSRHLALKHRDEPEVCCALSLSKGSKKRKLCWQKLINKGNHLHNVEVLEKGRGYIIPYKRPPFRIAAREYIPCPACIGYFIRKNLWRHHKECSVRLAEQETCDTSANKEVLTKKLKSKSGSSSSSTQNGVVVLTSNNDSARRVWDKPQYCVYCKQKLAGKLPRHLEVKHSDEPEVHFALSFPKGSKKRKLSWLKLSNKGNHIHNVEVLEKGSGYLIPCKRPQFHVAASKYIPCPACFGYFIKGDLWKHYKECPIKLSECKTTNTNGRRIQAKGAMLLPQSGNVSKSFKEQVLAAMNQDEVTIALRNDDLIVKYGTLEYKKVDPLSERLLFVKQKLRYLGRLLLSIRNIVNAPISLRECIHPSKFQMIQTAVQDISGNDASKPGTKQSIVVKIGYGLKKCATICEVDAIKSGNSENERAANEFLKLCDMEWLHKNSMHALRPAADSKLSLKDQDKIRMKQNSCKQLSKKKATDQKKRKVLGVRVPWSAKEKAAVQKYFKTHILSDKIPRAHECEDARKQYPILCDRSWRCIKYCVYNMLSCIKNNRRKQKTQ